MIICIETATNLCSVALCDSSGVISLKESNDLKTHASMLTVYIGDILKETGVSASSLEAVAVSKGPGSYTGLRIGVSVAKGIAFAATIPLIGIETTLSMFMGMSERIRKEGKMDLDTLFCPMLDARRMEVYYALYDSQGMTIKNISAEIISANSFTAIPESQRIIFFGDGALKCRNIIRRQNIHFEENFAMSSSYMCIPAFHALELKHFEDVAYFEPFYLKDFITTTQRKNILG
jgi:tRNA threonylcarbamoyladenosine biosynthesis protein TsaB